MDSIIEEKEEDYDYIKIYLHIHYPKVEDKPYYKIDLDKNVLVLYDSINRKNSEKDGIFEMDRIFTNENDNSYIFEEICSNTIKEAIKGESYAFISYGNTISDKLKILIGDVNDSYTNVSHRGLFPNLLEKLISTINNNKSYRENLSINLSYFILLYDKIIDLSNYIGHKLDDLNECNFIKDAVELEEKSENLKKIKKVPTENINDVLFFINKLFLLLINLEEESEHHIYSRGHFSIIIYVINNSGKIVSTLSFILLNGSEIIFRNNRPQNINDQMTNEQSYKKNVSTSVITIDTQYTYDSIIYSLNNNNYINRNSGIEQIDKDSNKNIDYTEKHKTSRLTKLLYDICFGPNKEHIKFRIIGTILPNTGYYDTCKDTLMFLFNCNKVISNITKNKEKSLLKGNRLSKSNINHRNSMLRKDTVFDLENKVKIQTTTIEELNRNIERKHEKLIELERYYKKQVDALKNFFGFKGNIEILLAGEENSKEYKEAQKIRDAKDEINYYKRNINELEKKLINKDDESAKLKLEYDIKSNDKTMVTYYLGVNEIKKKKQEDNKDRNDTFNQIQIYEKELKNKDKVINKLKNELEKKSKIIMSIPKAIKNHMDKKDDESSISSGDIIEIKYRKKGVNKYDLIKLAKDNDEEIKTLNNKYENLINQKDKEILENNYQMNKIKSDNNTKIKLYEDELIKLYNLFNNIFNYTNNKFFPFFNQKSNIVSLYKKKEELETFLEITEKEINAYNFPFIFKALNERKKYSKNSSKNPYKEKIDLEIKNNIVNKNRIKEVEDSKNVVLNFEDFPYPTLQQINNFINTRIANKTYIYTQNEFESLSKSKLFVIYDNIIKYINQLETYIKKYTEKIEKSKIIDKKEEINKKIENLKEKVKKLEIMLDKEVQNNTKNMVVISSQKKLIEQLQRENTMSKNILKYKNDISSYKMSLSKSKDKYPIIVHDQCNTINENENNILNYKKSSFHIKRRNNTENNYSSNIQPTNGTSGYSSYVKTLAPTIDNYNNFSQNKIKRRPFSSKPNKVKNKI